MIHKFTPNAQTRAHSAQPSDRGNLNPVTRTPAPARADKIKVANLK